jgi:hypothetical protein
MANNRGSAIIDFSQTATPYAYTVVTGQTDIDATAYIESWIMRDSTADHSDYNHMLAPIILRCGDIVPGVSFTIHAVSDFPLRGEFQVRWVWVTT